MSPTRTALTDVLELAMLERGPDDAFWKARTAAIPAWHARNEEGDGDGDGDEGGDGGDDAAAAAAAKEKADADAAAAKAKADEAALGDAGKAALAEERKARKAAEKTAKDAQAALKAREDAELSETDKLKKRAEEAEAKTSGATEKLRRVNVLSALADKGLTGAKAKAAARLLDDVEFDDDDEPTNLDDAIKAAAAAYGEDNFKGAMPKRKAPKTDGGGADEDRDGPTLTADELLAAKAAGMTPEEYETYKSPRPKLPATT